MLLQEITSLGKSKVFMRTGLASGGNVYPAYVCGSYNTQNSETNFRFEGIQMFKETYFRGVTWDELRPLIQSYRVRDSGSNWGKSYEMVNLTGIGKTDASSGDLVTDGTVNFIWTNELIETYDSSTLTLTTEINDIGLDPIPLSRRVHKVVADTNTTDNGDEGNAGVLTYPKEKGKYFKTNDFSRLFTDKPDPSDHEVNETLLELEIFGERRWIVGGATSTAQLFNPAYDDDDYEYQEYNINTGLDDYIYNHKSTMHQRMSETNYSILNTYDWLSAGSFEFNQFNQLVTNTIQYTVRDGPATLLNGSIPVNLSLSSEGKVTVFGDTIVSTNTDAGETNAVVQTITSNYVDEMFDILFQNTKTTMTTKDLNFGEITSLDYDPEFALTLNFDQDAILNNFANTYGNITLSAASLSVKLPAGLTMKSDTITPDNNGWYVIVNSNFKFGPNGEGEAECVILNNKIPVASTVSITDASTYVNEFTATKCSIASVFDLMQDSEIEYKVDCTITANLLNTGRTVTYRNTFADAAVMGNLNTPTALSNNVNVGISRTLMIAGGSGLVGIVTMLLSLVGFAVTRMRQRKLR
jgi:hypothetical protein